jgi:hypothetical protein
MDMTSSSAAKPIPLTRAEKLAKELAEKVDKKLAARERKDLEMAVRSSRTVQPQRRSSRTGQPTNRLVARPLPLTKAEKVAKEQADEDLEELQKGIRLSEKLDVRLREG